MNFSGRLMTFTELLANAKLINSFKTGERFTTFLKFTTQKGGKSNNSLPLHVGWTCSFLYFAVKRGNTYQKDD